MHLLLDKRCGTRACRETTATFGLVAHVRPIGEDAAAVGGRNRRKKPRRWVAVHTIGWLNRRRAILVPYAKRAVNDPGLIQLACSLPWYGRLERS